MWRLFACEVVFSRSRAKVEDYYDCVLLFTSCLPVTCSHIVSTARPKRNGKFLLRRLKVVCSPPLIFLRIVEKKTGCISLSFSLMLCWVNNNDAILKVNPYLEDILCIRKFRPLCSFPSRCVRLGEDPISEATRKKQICETRIEDEREYKVFVTVVCYWKLFFAFILVQEVSSERTVALEMEYFSFSHWWFTKYIIFYSSMKVQQTKIQL